MRASLVLLMIIALGTASAAEEKKGKGLQLKNLPAAVQTGIQANLKGAEVKNISKEKENGVEQYEVETVLNGKVRDFDVDSKGTLLLIEEEISIDAIPAAAKAGIMKKIGDGKLQMVESYAKPGKPMLYEASYTDKKGAKKEVLVKADGTETKD
jgi:hypothetical protein